MSTTLSEVAEIKVTEMDIHSMFSGLRLPSLIRWRKESLTILKIVHFYKGL